VPVLPACTCLSCPTHPRGGCELYPSSMSDTQWATIAPVLPPPANQTVRGRPEAHARRLILDAVFYLVAEGFGGGRRPRTSRRGRRSTGSSPAGATTAPGSGSLTRRATRSAFWRAVTRCLPLR